MAQNKARWSQWKKWDQRGFPKSSNFSKAQYKIGNGIPIKGVFTALYHVRDFLGPRGFIVAYKSFVRPVCEYGSVAIMRVSATHLSKLDFVQMAERFNRCKFSSLHSHRKVSAVGLLCKLFDSQGQGLLQHFCPAITTTLPTHSYSLRSLSCDLMLVSSRLNIHPWVGLSPLCFYIAY